MAITDLIPWRRDESRLPVRRRREEDTLFDIRSQMNLMFDEFFERPFGLSPFFDETSTMREFTPSMDVNETDKEITIMAELPGMEPGDIDISLDRNALRLMGEKHADKEEKGKHYYRVERSYGSFQRVIPLPCEVDEDKIDATYKRGVLKVVLPKLKPAQEITKRITIKSG
jgi:HSP20 family protein